MHDKIAAVILAGGGARRMFPHSETGGDKALSLLAGAPMIAHVVARVRSQVPHVLVNANGNPARFGDLFGNLPIVADSEPDRGPLAGLLAAMDHLLRGATSHSALLSVSTDTPFLPEDLAERLCEAAGHGAAIAASQGRRHPVIGFWPLSLRDALAESLEQGQRSVEKFALRQQAIEVPFPLRTIGARTVDPFFNANTPQDLALAAAILSET